MKKHTLLKFLGILLLLVVIASYLLPGRGGEKDYIGLVDVAFNGYQTLYYFYYFVIFILSIGGFYGVLNKSPRYKKLLDKLVTKIKPFGKKFVLITILMFALLASFTGMTLPMMIFIPFVMSIILLLGYDKLVAISATVVSTLVGYIGGVFVTFFNSKTGLMSTYETFVEAESKFANLFPKLLLLFAGTALLIYYVNNHIKNVEKKKVKYELPEDSEVHISEVTNDYSKMKTWPIAVVILLLFVVIILGVVPWNTLFEITIFQEFHTWLTELTIKDFAIIPNILSDQLPAFGEWYSMGDILAYVVISFVLLLFTIIVKLVGKIKINDAIDGYKEGMKKTLPAAALVILALTIFICTYFNGFYDGLITSYGKFNYGISSLLILLGCLLNVDIYYIVSGVFTPILNLVTDESVYTSVALLFQGIYGIFSIIGPTSMILIFVLSYMNVPYTTWIKYIWRFVLGLIVLLALVTLIIIFL